MRNNRRRREPDPYDGILLVDKPGEWTSHDVVAKVRNYFKFNKVGHGGTLDPLATGLLVLLIGKGTKLSDRIMTGDKVYEGTIHLGVTTHSQDRDGEVLDDPESFKTKEESKKSVLDYILQPDLYPLLYKNLCHVVRINYYPPRGDNKEGWDNIDLVGWLGYPMQLKINFLCRDSILAAPIVLDVALFLDLAKRAGMSGIQEWLSFYFKSPMHAANVYPEHDLFIQLMKLKNTLRHLRDEDLITHLGREYYD